MANQGYNFDKHEWISLLISIVLLTFSIPGQTFFLGYFSEYLIMSQSVSTQTISLIFAISTVFTALFMHLFGKYSDTRSVSEAAFFSGFVLALGGILLTASLSNLTILLVAFSLIRLGGQGLLIHTALTNIVKAIKHRSSTAYGLTNFIYSLITLSVPFIVPYLSSLLGWPRLWITLSVLTLVGTSWVAWAAARQSFKEPIESSQDTLETVSHHYNLTEPAMMGVRCTLLLMSSLLTILFLHQASFNISFDLEPEFLFRAYPVFLSCQLVTTLTLGPMIDKFSALRLLPLLFIPVCLGLLVILVLNQPILIYLALGLLGISAGFDILLGSIIWKEVYPADQFGKYRSRFEAIRIVVIGCSPIAFSALIKLGITVPIVLWTFFGLSVAAAVFTTATSIIHRNRALSHVSE